MMKKVKLGVIGLGARGYSMLRDVILTFPEIEVSAVCDLYPDRVARAARLIREKRVTAPYQTTDYRDLFDKADIDAVYIPTAWETHIDIAIAAIRRGIITALEVGGAYHLEECFDLVRAYEESGTPTMLMENCCFYRDELLATAMARAGKFGRIVYCHGAYAHDLRGEIARGNLDRHYRLRNYLSRNCENYPTHELGPIAKLLNINRGNRFVSLVSVASCAAGMEDYLLDRPELVAQDPTLAGARFCQGDIVNTLITCQNGELISLRLDTTLPCAYDREFTVRGTKGSYCQTTNSVFLDGDPEAYAGAPFVLKTFGNAKQYEDEFLPQIWKDLSDEAKRVTHGGMDGVMFRVFLDHIASGEPMPIDVYDAAAWMSVTALSAQSIAQGGAPQACPDFTRGKYLIREPADVIPLCGGKKFSSRMTI